MQVVVGRLRGVVRPTPVTRTVALSNALKFVARSTLADVGSKPSDGAAVNEGCASVMPLASFGSGYFPFGL